MTRRQAQNFDQALLGRSSGAVDPPAALAPAPQPPVAEAKLVDDNSAAAGGPPPVKESTLADSPVVIREKIHQAKPMSVEEAIYEMELVGHPFFLFVDSASGLPSVLYHRHGWTYGVLRLETTPTPEPANR
jgi:hypothetical protein